MKRLFTLAVFAPTSALAHGGHAAMEEPLHGSFHSVPLVVAVALVVAALAVWRARE